MKFPTKPILIIFLLASPLAHAQTDLLQQSSFDENIDGWTDVGQPGGSITWDGSMGFPDAGSLRISSSLPEGTNVGFRAGGRCLNVSVGEKFTVEANIFAIYGDRNGICLAHTFLYREPQCQGRPFGTGTGGSFDVIENEWYRTKKTTTVFEGVQSIRAGFFMALLDDEQGTATCHFNEVLFYRGEELQQASPVPVDFVPGLAVFIALALVISGLWHLGRRL